MRSLGRAGDALVLSPDHEPGSADRVASIVRRWHNGEHVGAFRTCDLQPCGAVVREIYHENRGNEDDRTPPLQMTTRAAHIAAMTAAYAGDERAPDDVTKKGRR